MAARGYSGSVEHVHQLGSLFDNYVESFQCGGPFRTVAVSLMWGKG